MHWKSAVSGRGRLSAMTGRGLARRFAAGAWRGDAGGAAGAQLTGANKTPGRERCADAARDVAAGGGDRGGEGQEGEVRARADGEGLHRHRGWRAADDQLLRAAEFAARADTPIAALTTHQAKRTSRSTTGWRASRSRRETPGEVKYKDKRLLALYFDMTAMPPTGPDARAGPRRRSLCARR